MFSTTLSDYNLILVVRTSLRTCMYISDNSAYNLSYRLSKIRATAWILKPKYWVKQWKNWTLYSNKHAGAYAPVTRKNQDKTNHTGENTDQRNTTLTGIC